MSINWNIIKGGWKEMSGFAKEKWGDLTDNDLMEAEGDRERLIGALQRRYGLAQEEAARQVDEWAASIKDTVRS